MGLVLSLEGVNKCIHICRKIPQRQVSWEKYLLQPSKVMAKAGSRILPCSTLKLLVFNQIVEFCGPLRLAPSLATHMP